MNNQDQKLCSDLLSLGKAAGTISLIRVTRNGSLLLALPSDKGVSLATLKLYQPQKWKGRFFRMMFRLMVLSGLHRFLPKQEFVIGESGLLSGLGDSIDKDKFGFLLSNADSSKRNLIGLFRDGDEYLVIKAGCGISSSSVKMEYETMKEFSQQISGLPRCVSSFPIENGYAYVAECVQGRSPRSKNDEICVFDVLRQWLEKGKPLYVQNLDCWLAFKAKLSAEQYEPFVALEEALIVSPVMHGDFAPWNIKILSDGSAKVIDWESAMKDGVPVWDWLHYNVQRKKLVDGLDDHAVIEACRRVLLSGQVQSYLEQSGLVGKEEELLGSYLYFSGKVQNYPRSELIDVWTESHANDKR